MLPLEESIPVHRNDWSLDALLTGDGSVFRHKGASKNEGFEKIDPLDPGPAKAEIF